MIPPVKGRCPHGCGETLILGEGGYVTCSWSECPDPGAVSHLLASAEDKRDLLKRTAGAIHTLYYANERAGERYRWLKASIEGDDELVAFQALNVGLINFEPLPPGSLAGLRRVTERLEQADANRVKGPSERITVEATTPGEEAAYVKRLLETMYTRWHGTLDYERGVHTFTLYSPFDPEGRRHTTSVYVYVDGETTEARVRRYVLGPYLLVKDERTRRESNDPWRVLNGDLTRILPEGENSHSDPAARG